MSRGTCVAVTCKMSAFNTMCASFLLKTADPLSQTLRHINDELSLSYDWPRTLRRRFQSPDSQTIDTTNLRYGALILIFLLSTASFSLTSETTYTPQAEILCTPYIYPNYTSHSRPRRLYDFDRGDGSERISGHGNSEECGRFERAEADHSSGQRGPFSAFSPSGHRQI